MGLENDFETLLRRNKGPAEAN